MKKAIWFLAALMLVCLAAHAVKVDSTMLIYLEDSAGEIIWNGNNLSVDHGGVLDIKSGGYFKIAGTAVTATAAELNAISASGAPTISGANITAGTIPRASLAEDALKKYKIPYSAILDSALTPLNAAGGATLLKYGAVGTGVIGLTGETVDDTTEATTSYITVGLPAEYVAAGDVQIVIVCKITNAATTATVDFTAKEISLTGGTVGSDICATAAQTITTSFAAKTFTITATDLVAGDLLQLEMSTSILDATGGTTTAIQITEIYLLADVKG